ncbi:MAG: undecaprenyldiphospho-muramoylpentapeptide beta-N-acetylglucosaminyltransferase [bacterium]|nr:undecaprenyldiphospho-muramoylpentapeptide beta-N-acetylglucosaminyltransferase [bacterium]
MEKARIVFAGGGTGGHLYPALAIANRLKELLKEKNEVVIEFAGTKRGIEYRMRDNLGYKLNLVNIRGLSRSLTLSNLIVPFLVIGALIKSYFLLGRIKPDVVVGTGGYVCWPIVRAASLRSIPIVLQEQNSFPGLTIRQLAGFADRIYLGFEKGAEFLKSDAQLMVSGNPVRSEISHGDRKLALYHYDLDPGKKTILVLGGSQGARAINNAILESLKNDPLKDKYQLLWQTGKRDYTDVCDETGKRASCALFPFAQQMELVYAAADIVIARAGALTLAELEACKLPSILIPYPHAAGDHQKKNAEWFQQRKIARMIEEPELEKINIIAEAISILESQEFERMKTAFHQGDKKRLPAVDIIANGIIEIIEQQKEKLATA